MAFVCEKTYGITGIDLDQVNLDELKVDSIRYLGYYLKRHGKRILPRRLVVIESPGKEKTLARYLGPDYRIMATRGAITEMDDQFKNLELFVKSGMKPGFLLKEEKREIIDAIRKESPMVEEIILATDDDYMGETIAWHIFMQFRNELEIQNKMTRVRLSSMTESSIKKAFDVEGIARYEQDCRQAEKENDHEMLARLRQQYMTSRPKINMHRVKAELFREMVDALILARFHAIDSCVLQDRSTLHRFVQLGMATRNDSFDRPASMGRVKLGILALLMKNARQQAEKIESGVLDVLFEFDNHRSLTGTVHGNANSISQIVSHIKKSGVEYDGRKRVTGNPDMWAFDSEIKVARVEKTPPTGSTMDVLKFANRQFGMKPHVVMEALQKLYEGSFHGE